MKIRPSHITTRYAYRPDLIPVHGSPIYDLKYKKIIPPTATVRVRDQFLTPKQIVYILYRAKINTALTDAGAPEDTHTPITLPKFILFKDGNPANIRAENLQASSQSNRWKGQRRMVESISGVAVPREFIGHISPDMMDSLGISPDDINQ
jgi:hypothetical protein